MLGRIALACSVLVACGPGPRGGDDTGDDTGDDAVDAAVTADGGGTHVDAASGGVDAATAVPDAPQAS